MSGLMMVFLLISVAQMLSLQRQVRKPVEDVQTLCDGLQGLPLERWDASIGSGSTVESRESGLDCLTIRFDDPAGHFAQNSAVLPVSFQEELAEFVTELLKIIRPWEEKWNDEDSEPDREIWEVRIEGHTSSEYAGAENSLDAYLKNMDLSQRRAHSVLQHILDHVVRVSDESHEWVRERVRAVGFSSSQLVRDEMGFEDRGKSRRVLFRVSTNLEEILRRLSDDGEREP